MKEARLLSASAREAEVVGQAFAVEVFGFMIQDLLFHVRAKRERFKTF